MVKKTTNIAKYVIIAVLIIVIILLIYTKTKGTRMYQPTINKTEFDWQKEYATKTTLLDESYFGPNDYIDSDNALIQQTATNIAASSNGVEEAVQKSLDYVYENVEYNAGESDEICFNAKASTVLESKTGQCDTQTITLERAQKCLGE